MSKNHIDANVTTEDLAHLPLTDVAERMIESVQRILKRDLHIENGWRKALAELSPAQKLAVWLEAIESIN